MAVEILEKIVLAGNSNSFLSCKNTPLLKEVLTCCTIWYLATKCAQKEHRFPLHHHILLDPKRIYNRAIPVKTDYKIKAELLCNVCGYNVRKKCARINGMNSRSPPCTLVEGVPQKSDTILHNFWSWRLKIFRFAES